MVSSEPVRVDHISKVLDLPSSLVEGALGDLRRQYLNRPASGIRIERLSGGFQMCSHPALSVDLARLLALPKDRARLSKPALETVAVIAYQQPVTQAEIEAIRGVSVDGVVRTLMERRLVQEAGRKSVPGRPILYCTTPEFLHYFGLDTVDDLPPLDEIVAAEEDAARIETLEAVGLAND